MDYEALKFWWDVFITCALAAISVWSWLQARSTATANDMRALRDWVQEELAEKAEAHHALAARVGRVETELKHAPARPEITELVEKMAETQSELSRAVGELAGLNRQMRLVQEHLLRSSSK